MSKTEFRFVADAASPRLDSFLTEEFEALDINFSATRSYIKQLILEGAVKNSAGVPILKPAYSVRCGDHFLVLFDEPKPLSAEAEDIPLQIVFQNNNFAVINKPQGLVVHPCDTAPAHTLVNALLYHIKDLSSINGIIRPGIVHRLDKDTSGLLVIAKNDMAHLSLQKQIQEKTAERRYLAIVDRNLKQDEGTVDLPLARNPRNRLQMAYAVDGRRAVTHFAVKERFGDYTLVEFVLETGRTHQIRAHAKHLGHPICGDELYGGSNKFKLKGQLLHAYSLAFNEPTSGERMTFFADLPSDFKRVLELLRKKEED